MKNFLCIDFGSSYTKVALRREWCEPTGLIKGIGIAEMEENQRIGFCIPSVVMRLNRNGQVEWYSGQQAADTPAGPNDQLFQHWKRWLFSAAGWAPLVAHQREVAKVFFQKLLENVNEFLMKQSLPEHSEHFPVRISVPRLGGEQQDSQERQILDVLQEAGWYVSPRTRSINYEPEANICGILTHGRNWAWFPRSYEWLHHHNGRMFDSEGDFFLALRQGARSGAGAKYEVLVVDVGAFTTDFGYVCFDSSFGNDDPLSKPGIIQQSVELGVNELDLQVRQGLSSQAQQAVQSITLSRWERTKRDLYAGKEVRILAPPGGTLQLGGGQDRQMIENAIRAFAQRVINEMGAFRRKNGVTNPRAVILTGGGSMIPLLRNALTEELRQIPGLIISDVQGDFIRGSSAIGGCSVFFDLPEANINKEEAGPLRPFFPS